MAEVSDKDRLRPTCLITSYLRVLFTFLSLRCGCAGSAAVFCILQHSFSIKSRPWIWGLHEDSCFDRCWNLHINQQWSRCSKSHRGSGSSGSVNLQQDLLFAIRAPLALLTVWRSAVLHNWETSLRNVANAHLTVMMIKGWIMGHGSCKSLILAKQNANGVSLLIFIVLAFHFIFFTHTQKAANMSSLCYLFTLIVCTEQQNNNNKKKTGKKN